MPALVTGGHAPPRPRGSARPARGDRIGARGDRIGIMSGMGAGDAAT